MEEIATMHKKTNRPRPKLCTKKAFLHVGWHSILLVKYFHQMLQIRSQMGLKSSKNKAFST